MDFSKASHGSVKRLLGLVLAVWLLGGCAGQYYQVTGVSQTGLPVEYGVEALDGRINGYSVRIRNTSEKIMEINWGAALIRQAEGYDVPVSIQPSTKISRVYPGGKVEYHLKAKHAYQVKERRFKSIRDIWWQDVSDPWPPATKSVTLPVRFMETTECPTCGWQLAKITIKQRVQWGKVQEEDEEWVGDRLYMPGTSERPFRLGFGMGMGSLNTYETFTGSSVNVEAGYAILTNLTVDVVAQFWNVELEESTSLQDDFGKPLQEVALSSSLFGLRLAYTQPLYGFVSATAYGQLGLADSEYRFNAGTRWTQGDIMAGGGARLVFSFRGGLDMFVGYDFASGIAPLGVSEDALGEVGWTKTEPSSALTTFGLRLRL